MKRIWIGICLCWAINLQAQVERIYDDNGNLKAIIPLNSDGFWDGKGLVYHPNGSIAEEIPYQSGKLHGEAIGFFPDGNLRYTAYFVDNHKEGLHTEYFPDGQIKLTQLWQDSTKHGPMRAYFQDGKLRIFGAMVRDSLLFAQYYDKTGRIISEKVGYIKYPIDTAQLPAPRLILAKGSALTLGVPNAVYLSLPEVPQDFISFSSPHGTIGKQHDPRFPILLTPNAKIGHMDVYLLVQTTTFGGPKIVRKVTIPVEP